MRTLQLDLLLVLVLFELEQLGVIRTLLGRPLIVLVCMRRYQIDG